MTDRPRPYHYPAYWLLGFLLILLIPPMLNAPFGRDQGIFAWVAGVMLDGGVPYRDAWDIKGPLTYYVYAASLWLSAKQSWGIYIADIILLSAALSLLFRRLEAQRACVAGIILLGIGMTSYLNAGQPDTWCAFLAICLACLLTEREKAGKLAGAGLAGCMLGCMCLFKPHYVFFAPAIVLAYLYSGQSLHVIMRQILTCAFVSAGVVSAGLFALYMHGGWPAFLDVSRFALVSHLGHAGIFTAFLGLMIPADAYEAVRLIYLAVALVGLWILYRKDRNMALVWSGFMLAALLVYLIQGKLLRYQLMPLLALAVFPVTLALSAATQKLVSSRQDWPVALGLGGFAVSLLVTVTGLYPHGFLQWKTCLFRPDHTCLSHYVIEGMTAQHVTEAAMFMRQNSQLGDRIFLWGSDAAVYTLANRRATSSLGYSYPMLGTNHELRQRYRQQLLADLQHANAHFIVIGLKDASPVTDPEGYRATQGYHPLNSIDVLPQFPELAQLVESRYRTVYENPFMRVYGLGVSADKAQ